MPLYRYRCSNSNCKHYDADIEYFVKNINDEIICKECSTALIRQFPQVLHAKDIKGSLDNKDLGKVTQEKNEALKKRWSGYSYEEQNVRKAVSKMAEDKIKKEHS